ncbi:MAG: nuclear transport factor 2 family protein [Bradyrhizobium sp.]|nr:nuclear transport factor 2 family protein [Bradyrhizobium sp.]MBI5262341.1 nuclear transport factor 2 family protein [Bradyrhizobium sp.]
MVEHLNRRRALNLLNALSARDIGGALECCTEDVDFLSHAPIDVLPHMGPRHGKAELKDLWQTVMSRYSELRYEIPLIVADDAQVAAYLRAFFRKRSNSRIVQFDMAVFLAFRDGRIAQIREVIDSYDLVQQVIERDIGPLIMGRRPD